MEKDNRTATAKKRNGVASNERATAKKADGVKTQVNKKNQIYKADVERLLLRLGRKSSASGGMG